MDFQRYWFALGWLALCTTAQAATPVLEFDGAAIKPNSAGGKRSGIDSTTGFWKAENVALRFLITYAYQVLPDQVTGGPGWIDGDRYDTEAKYEQDPALSGSQNAEQTRVRLQALLKSRFQLEMHRQTRDWQVYVLVAGRRGRN